MAGKPAVLAIKVIADAKQAQAELDGASGAVKKTGDKLGKLAAPAAIALGGIVAFGKTAVGAASEVEQSMGGLEAVFGKNADAAKDLANNAAKSTGLATADYATMAAQIGAQLKGMGTAQKDLVPSTKRLIDLGADLAATYGGTTADAVSAVSSLLRGESDPIERYGVSIKAAAVSAEMAKEGLTGLTGAAATQAQAQATLTLLTKQTADAQGQFAAQTSTTGEQQQIAAAEMKNATAALGKGLLPAVTAVTKVLADMAAWVGKNSRLATILIGIVAGLAAAILIANAAIKAVTAVTRIWTAVQAAFNFVMNLNPISLVVIAIAALVAGIIIAYAKVGWFKAFVDGSFKAILDIVKTVAAWIQKYLGPVMGAGFEAASKALGVLGDAFSRTFSAIKAVISGVLDIIGTVAGAVQKVIDLISRIKLPNLSKLNPFAKAAPASAVSNRAGLQAVSSRRVAGSRATSSSAAGVQINVNGALDPDAVARQIRALLSRADVRNGARVGVTRGWTAGVVT